MVPVRKPGRPLSACPHPRDQACGCGSVTAAIPRKQTCHCGTPSQSATPVGPRPINGMSDLPSPNKPSFKVQKASRPSSSRKQSFDPTNIGRIDMNHVNIQPFEQKTSDVPVAFTNGYTMATPGAVYGFTPQYASMQAQYGMVPMQPPPHRGDVNGSVGPAMNGYGNGNGVYHNGLEKVMESPIATPMMFGNGHTEDRNLNNGHAFIDSGKTVSNVNGNDNAPRAGSCCAPKQISHSHSSSSSSSSSSISEPPEPPRASCCAPKAETTVLKKEPGCCSTQNTPQIPHQTLQQNTMPHNNAIYQQFVPQPTIFTYSQNYGSWQNPLQPSAWKDGMRSNHAQPELPLLPNGLTFEAPVISDNLDTVHTCGCGDTCQCVGCAAHPYNDATQDYVRSAYAEMSIDRPTSESFQTQPATNGGMNGHAPTQGQNGDVSPTALTPSSTTSGTADDQNLSADNFLFVNYPFTGEGCGGDMQECPCGDDCECIGCTIHGNQLQDIPMPCCGSKHDCPCGDDCQCIGCEIHKTTVTA